VLRWSQSALLATTVGPENAYLWFEPVKMAKILTNIHERVGFPDLEELFAAANGYLVNRSPNDTE